MVAFHCSIKNWLYIYTLIYFNPLCDACSTTVVLTASEGTVFSPTTEFGLGYPNNLDHCWLIRGDGKSVAIKFITLDIELCCDFVHIYQNTEAPSNASQFVQLNGYVVNHYEFWLPHKGLVRFRTDSSVQRTGFEFTYRLVDLFVAPGIGLPAPLEIISGHKLPKQAAGGIHSHVDFGGQKYPKNYIKVWRIECDSDSLVTLIFTVFRTQPDEDVLVIFQGNSLNADSKSHTLSGVLSGPTILNLIGTVTMVFWSRSSLTGDGFEIKVFFGTAVARLKPVKRWSGKAGELENSQKILVHSLVQLDRSCDVYLMCTQSPILVTLRNFTLEEKIYYSLKILSQPKAAGGCVEKIVCTATINDTMNTPSKISHKLELPVADPETLEIEFINQDLWNLTGMIQFRVVSNFACPSVRHSCELITPNGSSLPASQVQLMVSDPNPSDCLSSVTSHFAVSASVANGFLSAGMVISCRLANGSLVEGQVPLLNQIQSRSPILHSDTVNPESKALILKASNFPERALTIVGFITAGLAIAALIGVIYKMKKQTSQRQLQGRNESAANLNHRDEEYDDGEYAYPRSMSMLNTPDQ